MVLLLNASPTMPNILLYSHEGPWALVGLHDQKFWCLDISTGRA